MKKNMFSTILSIVFLLMCCAGNLFGQDLITKKNGDKMKVIIKEISDTEVKYVDYRDQEGVVFVMDRALIREIKFSYGEKIKEVGPSQDESYYVDDPNQNIKINFTSINSNFLIFTYERAIDLKSSFEGTLKLPGLGINHNNSDFSGVGFSAGYKLKLGSIFKKDGYRPKQVLEGSYFRVTGGYVYSMEKDKNSNNNRKIERSAANLGLDFGRQWTIAGRVALDVFIGYHYYLGGASVYTNNISQPSYDSYFGGNEFRGGDVVGGDNNAISFGIRVGILFGRYGEDGKKRKNRR